MAVSVRTMVVLALATALVAPAMSGCCCAPVQKPLEEALRRFGPADEAKKADPVHGDGDADGIGDVGASGYENADSLAAYAAMVAAAGGGFDVFRPGWLPDGFRAAKAGFEEQEGAPSLFVEYERADDGARVVVAQLTGDLGEIEPDSAVAWGDDGGFGMMYEDFPYWDWRMSGDEYEAGYMVFYFDTSPAIMLSTVGLDGTDVARISSSMMRVEP